MRIKKIGLKILFVPKALLKEVKKGIPMSLKISLITIILVGNLFILRQLGNSVSYQTEALKILAQHIKHSEIINMETIKDILESGKETVRDIDNISKNQGRLTKGLSNLLKFTAKNLNGILRDQGKLTERVSSLLESTEEMSIKFKMPDLRKLIKANVTVFNKTKHAMGSGIIIKYKEKMYILSVAHVNGDPTSELHMGNKQDFRPLKIIGSNKKYDLALFRLPKNLEDIDYVEISKVDPKLGDKIWVIGNPVGITGLITHGIVAKHYSFYWFITAPVLFGNSGGGVVNQKGELIGVTTALFTSITEKSMIATIGVIVDLETIKDFLSETLDGKK